jgi:hypothetical protein
MNTIRIYPLAMVVIRGVTVFGQSGPLDSFNQITAEIGQHMAQMGVGLSDVGRVEMLVQQSNPFQTSPGKLGNPILMKESVLMFAPPCHRFIPPKRRRRATPST